MKLFSTIIIFLSFSALYAQVIEVTEESIELKNGSKVIGNFQNEDDDYYYFILAGESEARRIPKKSVKSVSRAELWSQPYRYNDAGQVEYQEVIEVAGATADQLYNAARLWFSKTYNNSEAVLELDDRQAGALMGTGFSKIYTKVMGLSNSAKLWSTMQVEVKDGRYRYTLNDIRVQDYPSDYNLTPAKLPINAIWPEGKDLRKVEKLYREDSLLNLQALINSLKESMASATTDDW